MYTNVQYKKFELPVELTVTVDDGQWKRVEGEATVVDGGFKYEFQVNAWLENGHLSSGDCMVNIAHEGRHLMTEFVDINIR